MSQRLEAIYANDQRRKDYQYGFRNALKAAAEFVDCFDGQRIEYRLGDLLLCKFNQTTRKPRKSKNRKQQ